MINIPKRLCRYCVEWFMPARAFQIYCKPPCKRADERHTGSMNRMKYTARLPLVGTPTECEDGRGAVKDCAHHAACLDHAVAQSWDAFSCANCQRHEPVIDRAENYGRHESPAAQMERACPNMSGVDASRMDSQMSRRFKALGWDKHAKRNRKQGGGSL